MRKNTPEWTNYEFQPAFILGFHGCDVKVGEAILRGESPHLTPSKNDYDWLGRGVYFWEGNPARALQFATECAQGSRSSKGKITKPFVLGAVINLGHCLDLADSSAIAQVQDSYFSVTEIAKAFIAEGHDYELPQNGEDLKARRLDCLVFNSLHLTREKDGLLPYDSVRGLFWEGEQIYPLAGVRENNHIQICVCNPENILGYFRPILPELSR